MKSPFVAISSLAGPAIAVLALAACGEPSTSLTGVASLENFCADAQMTIADTGIVPVNVVHTSFEKFVAATAAIGEERLETHQFVTYDETRGTATVVSCKLRSTDRIKMVRGPEASGAEFACGVLNRRTVDAVGLDPARTTAVIFDADEDVKTEAEWLSPWPYDVAYRAADGTLHIRAKSLLLPFNPFSTLPEDLKGSHYCHVIAPAYARALLVSEVEAPMGR